MAKSRSIQFPSSSNLKENLYFFSFLKFSLSWLKMSLLLQPCNLFIGLEFGLEAFIFRAELAFELADGEGEIDAEQEADEDDDDERRNGDS